MKELARSTTEELLQFIRKSPTAFHAVEQTERLLQANGFVRLEEKDEWKLVLGEKYYVTRNASSVIAFRMPQKAPRQLFISATHTDSPMFKLKTEAVSEAFGTYLRLNTEPYGGTIYSTWLDRPLSVAGRVILRQGNTLVSKNVNLDRDLLVIPSVAIHLNREVNRGYAYNPAIDLLPLYANANSAPTVKNLIAEALQCEENAIVGEDLYVYNRTEGSIWGASGEFFSAPRIDNLMCLYGTLCGFCNAVPSAHALNLLFSADNEETGSSTKQGAGSVFLSDTVDRICESLGVDRRQLLASSFMVSADNGHAKHPNHPELADAQNAPKMNGGVVIKTNAAQKYATDGVSAAIFKQICEKAGVPVQVYANRSDQAGGSTLGSISNTLVPLCTVDIGMAQLAMHSAYETAGCEDVAYLIEAMRAFYEAELECLGKDAYTLKFRESEGN